jgi:hypothetical protein
VLYRRRADGQAPVARRREPETPARRRRAARAAEQAAMADASAQARATADAQAPRPVVAAEPVAMEPSAASGVRGLFQNMRAKPARPGDEVPATAERPSRAGETGDVRIIPAAPPSVPDDRPAGEPIHQPGPVHEAGPVHALGQGQAPDHGHEAGQVPASGPVLEPSNVMILEGPVPEPVRSDPAAEPRPVAVIPAPGPEAAEDGDLFGDVDEFLVRLRRMQDEELRVC